MTKGVDIAYGGDIGTDRFTIALTASRGCHHGRRANVIRRNDGATRRDPADSAQERIGPHARNTGFSFRDLGLNAWWRALPPAQHADTCGLVRSASFYEIQKRRKVRMFGIIVRIRLG
ncbi:hypothetical protein [Burkholderia cepacia]|uniref:hypothetical protein n=1 Tax=Burkholderia cepacia TaxID=292 RepID=UPI000AB44E36|nr:hypothetical protein [Burkholderia cepacia]